MFHFFGGAAFLCMVLVVFGYCVSPIYTPDSMSMLHKLCIGPTAPVNCVGNFQQSNMRPSEAAAVGGEGEVEVAVLSSLVT